MNKTIAVVLGCVGVFAACAAEEAAAVARRVDAPIAVPADATYLDAMDLADATCGAGRTPRPRHTVEGGSISLTGKVFDRGLGVHAPFEFKFFANGAATRFTANVGVDDDMKDRPRASVRFLVLADDRVAADSGVLRAGERVALDADLTGAKWATLKVTDAGDGYACDHADWADAAFVFKPGEKWGNALLSRQLGILTPPESPAPRINGPSVFGVRPGHPILYRLPVTGERPMKLSVEGLPEGATFDAASGLLGGAVSKPGDYALAFTAANTRGVAKKKFTLKVGTTICLTPPLGWNSWNCWGQAVTDEKMRRAADAMVASGLADHGWSYIVVDDCWRTRPTEKEAGMKRPGWIGEVAHMYGPARTADDLPCTNPAFPDMRAMVAYIHAKGLKAGLYSVPATVACCWTWGSYGHEAKDAEVWADWGVDLLKYDWCTADRDWWRAGNDRERQFKAYKLMGDLLAKQKRDIVYNVCNYGRHGVTEWARAAGGQYWRTNDDLKDTWPLLIRSINENMNVADAAGPGGWNDPDMLVVGPMRSNNFTTSRLTPNEQYAHLSLWAIMAAPLFIGCDLERLDPLARSLLTNDEVLDIDQDALGKAGRPVVHTPDYDVWLRPLADGSWAVALFNRTWEEREIAADFAALGLPASCAVRDVWAQKDLGVFNGRFAASIPGHAALLYRLRSQCAARDNVPAAGSFLGTHAPTFWHGGEFPGATGRVEVVQDELRLHYDFTGGGHYVAARFGLPERPKAKRIAFEANLPESTEITVRIVDSTGQTFQYGFSGSTDGEWEEFSFVTEGIGARWGGANDGLLHLPLTEFAVLAENRGGATDVLRLRNIRFFERAELPQKMPEQPFDKAATEAGRLRDDLAHALPDLKRKGLGTKTRASLAVMDNFQSWIREDLARGFTNRAVRETHELVTVGREAKARLQAIAEGKVRDEPVPHFVTGPVETSHAQIIGTRAWPDGRRERGNVMLTGFGHFGKVQREQEKLPPLGNHVIQMEIGPWSVLKDEHVIDTNGFAPFFRAAALGAKENVQICLLLSPHYFPQWALKKWPHLSGCAGGFFKYCVHDEHAQAVIEKYLRTVIPLVHGNPALHSICLSNEPEQGHFGPDCALRKKWPGWLEKRHGTIAALNAKWGTSYASFADVPMPKSFKGNPATPATLDFVRFSRESFTAFHRRMADVIHELAPELPVHAKIMIFADFGNNATSYSVDPAAFAQLSAYNGNDAYVSYRGDQTRGDNTRGWVHDWWMMEAGYDYQRSAADKPIFNTENHIIADREKRSTPGRHVYAALWQNAVHGQSATTHWVWERAYDDGKSDFNGLILERPVCLAAWAHASLDLNRLADALAPIQNQEPTILLHRSLASEILGRQGAFLSCYRAASFLGQPLGVVTEEMLAEYARTGVRARPLAAARVVLLPRVTHLPDAARDGLKKLAAQGVKVFACRGKPAFDDCCRPRNADDFPYLDAPSEKRLALLFAERAGEWNLPDFPRVRAVDSEKGVYGVESHGYRTNGVSRVTFINHRAKPVRVRLEAPGRDLLSGTAVPQTLDLLPGVPLFVEY